MDAAAQRRGGPIGRFKAGSIRSRRARLRRPLRSTFGGGSRARRTLGLPRASQRRLLIAAGQRARSPQLERAAALSIRCPAAIVPGRRRLREFVRLRARAVHEREPEPAELRMQDRFGLL